MAKPMKTLQLHYPMIQFLMIAFMAVAIQRKKLILIMTEI